MKPAISLLLKDLREHGLTFGLLFCGLLFAISLSLLSNAAATFSVSPLEIVRSSVIWIIPLIAFIIGNGLITREYLGRTRLFVEALPVGRHTSFALKFILGWFYLSVLAMICVTLSSVAAQSTDIIDVRYFLLISLKTLTLVLLIWSVVFCLSFCGKLRIALYIILIGSLLFMANNPSFDHVRLGPFALLDQQLFAFERSEFPWQDLAETAALAFAFVLIAWLLVSLNEGSVAEMLAKPLSRRDYAGLGIFVAGGLLVFGIVAEKWTQEPDVFASGDVVTSKEPPISVLYLKSYRGTSEQLLEELSQVLASLQVELGLPTLPRVQVSLDPSLSPSEIDYRGKSSVLVSANFVEMNTFNWSTIRAVVIHQVLQVITNNRAHHEPTHWLLDGLSRWWSEHRLLQSGLSNQAELLARAVYSESKLAEHADIMMQWQRIAEQESYPSAEALAYSMVEFLVLEEGEETMLKLARDWLTSPAGGSSLETVKRLLYPVDRRFAEVTGREWEHFHQEWRMWLRSQRSMPQIAAFLDPLPALQASLEVVEANSSPRIVGRYSTTGDRSDAIEGECVLRHRLLSPFDIETDVQYADKDTGNCQFDTTVHDIIGNYGFGDRVLVVQEYVTEMFHEPIRLNAQRLTIE
ncbi:MAG: hypothetical protein KTR32_02595 [Granulosicoccus sp.]|nr:hypothetical protein [Granulosicoccus sp.]